MRRVVITGIGVISAVGLNQLDFLASLRSGRCGISTLDGVDEAHGVLRFKNAAQVRGYDPELALDPKELGFMDRFAQFAMSAAHEAMTQSGVELTPELKEKSAVVTGSCMGGRGSEEIGYWELFHNGRTRVHPLTIALGMSNAGASHISMKYGIQGPAYTVSTACASSAHAIGQAFWMVRSGAAPMAIAGGSEAPMFIGGLKAWEAMRVISKDTCRPFSLDRNGMILGEGGAILILEPLEAALARGATPLAEMVGFGMSSDASHITQPLSDGGARAIKPL